MAWSDVNRVGDIFYRKLAAWFLGGRSVEEALRIYDVAIEYQQALDEYLRYVETLPETEELRRDKGIALAYKGYLIDNLKSVLAVLPERPANVAQTTDLYVWD